RRRLERDDRRPPRRHRHRQRTAGRRPRAARPARAALLLRPARLQGRAVAGPARPAAAVAGGREGLSGPPRPGAPPERAEPLGPHPLAHRRVRHDAVERPDTVAPPDLLAFVVRATRVRDPDLVDPPAPARRLGRDLGLEAETVLLDHDALDDLAPERL